MPPDKKTQQENTNGILCFFFDRRGADEKRMESSRYWLPYSISNYTYGALIYCGLPDHSMCARLRTKSRANGAVVLRHASQRAGVRGEARAERPGLFRRFRSVQGTSPCERWRALPPTAAALTPAIMNEYVQKIVIHAPDKSSGKRRQRVQIFFNFLGEFNLPALNEPVIIENTPKNRKTA